MQALLDEYRAILETLPGKLREAGEGSAPAEGEWSRKEILGHLIDSASNNHQRFVRVQLEENPLFPGYEQEEWVKLQYYHEEPWERLVQLWENYNRHLYHLMVHVPPENLERRCQVIGNPPMTLQELMADYLDHLRHHVGQLRLEG